MLMIEKFTDVPSFAKDVIDKLHEYVKNRFVLAAGVPFVLWYMWYKRPSCFPPGPRGVPLLGVIPFISRLPARNFAKWSKKYGAIMSVRMGPNDLVILNTPEVIREAFVSQKSKFSGRPPIQLLFKLSEGHGLFFVDDSPMLWSQRKFGSTALRALGMGKKSFEQKVNDECEKLVEAIAGYHGNPFEILYLLTNAVSNNACLMTIGTRFDYTNKTFRDLLEHFCNSFYDSDAAFAVLACLCYERLAYLPGFSKYAKEIVADTKYCLDILQSIIDERKKNFDLSDPKCLIDYFYVEKKKTGHPDFTDKQLLMTVKDFLFGGTITTTSTIRWALYTIIKHPELQEKVYKEIEEQIADNEQVLYSERSKTPYTWAFLHEVMRTQTTVPLGVPHAATEDVEIQKFIIPKGTPVFSNFYACHMDPNLWVNPEQVIPERHLNFEGKFVPPRNIIPFSVGPRHCIGETIALAEIYIFFVTMVRRFKFSCSPSGTGLPSQDEAAMGLLNIPAPFEMVATQR